MIHIESTDMSASPKKGAVVHVPNYVKKQKVTSRK